LLLDEGLESSKDKRRARGVGGGGVAAAAARKRDSLSLVGDTFPRVGEAGRHLLGEDGREGLGVPKGVLVLSTQKVALCNV